MALAYFTRGTGPKKVLLLHGFLGSGRNLGSLAARWSEADPSLTLILPDQLGHGASPPLPEPPTLQALADAVVALQADLSAEEAPLVGHSLGGRVALRAASVRTPKIAMLDIAPSPIALTDGLDRVLQVLMAAPATAQSRAAMREHFINQDVSPALADWALMNLVAGDAGFAWRIDRQQLARMNDEASARDLWPDAERLQHKLVAIRGGASHFVSAADVERFSHLGVAVQTIAGAGHFLHLDEPQAVLAALQDLSV